MLAVVLVAVVSTVLVLVMPTEDEEREPRNQERILVEDLGGTIEEGAGGFYAAITPRRVEEVLEQAEEQPGVEGLVLRINSPGGSVAASQQISDMIREFDLPVVISMADNATSGGYYISAPADKIVAHPGTMTGSIGVIMTMMDMEGLYEKLGMEMETFTAGEHKDMFSRTLTEEERDKVEALLDESYQQFIEEIEQGRDLSYEEVKELATGELFKGSQAKELGLVDRLGGMEEAVELAGDLAGLEDPEKYRLPEPTFLDMLLGGGPAFSWSELPRWINHYLLPEEVALIDHARRGVEPELRYQLPGNGVRTPGIPGDLETELEGE